MGVLDKKPHTASVVTGDIPVEVLVISRYDFHHLVDARTQALYDKKTNLDAAALAFGAIILPPSLHLQNASPEVSITELVWSLGAGDHIEGAMKKSPSFSDSFAWVSG